MSGIEPRYVLTPRARADIFDIWSYIAQHSEGAADRVESAIYAACELVAEDPGRGHSRADLTDRPVRFCTVASYPNYTIVYRPGTAPPHIIAVLHGKRNLRRILTQRS